MARRPANLDASDPRLPLGVFQLCGCGERVIPAWETACPTCRGRAGVTAPTRSSPTVAPPPPPLPAPLHAPAATGTPRPTALHALPAAPAPRPPGPDPTTRRTMKVDLAAVRGTPVATVAPPPPPPPPAAPKRTVMLSLPSVPAPADPELVLAWAPPADEAHEGWTLHGATPDGSPVTLHLRWHDGRWRVLDATGAAVDASTLATLGLAVRGGLP